MKGHFDDNEQLELARCKYREQKLIDHYKQEKAWEEPIPVKFDATVPIHDIVRNYREALNNKDFGKWKE